jgi:hypothetical protein
MESKVEQTNNHHGLVLSPPFNKHFLMHCDCVFRFKCCDYVVRCQFPCWVQRFPWPTILITTFLLVILGNVPFLRCTSMSIKQSNIVAMACGSGIRHWKRCLLHFFYCTFWCPPPSNICVHVFGFLLRVTISKM